MSGRLTTFLTLVAAAGAGTLLFWTSQSVRQKEAELARIEAAAARETQAIRVLNAEWDYLNRPERLEKLASEYLKLVPPQPSQIVREATSSPAPLSPQEADTILPGRPPDKPDIPMATPAVFETTSSPSLSSSPPSLTSLPSPYSSVSPIPPRKPPYVSARDSSARSFQSLVEELTDEKKEGMR